MRHRYRQFNGVQNLARLQSVAINALRPQGILSGIDGIAAGFAYGIKAQLRVD